MSGTVDWAHVRGRLQASEESLAQPRTLEAAYRQRAIRLATRSPEFGAIQNSLQVIVFALSTERYGLEITAIAEVLRTAFITPVPDAPPHFAGVINVRGDIRPVLDLKCLLGIPEGEDRGSGYVLLLRQPGQQIGLKVDRVEGVRSILSEQLHTVSNGAPLTTRYFKGSTPDLLILLDPETLIIKF